MRIWQRKVWTLNDPRETRDLGVTDGGVLEQESSSRVTRVRPELDQDTVGLTLDDPGPGITVAELAQGLGPHGPGPVVHLDIVVVTLVTGLQVHVCQHHVYFTATCHQYPPRALRIMVVGLGIVGRADAAAG